MRITAMVAMAAVVGMSALADEKVTVYVQDGSVAPSPILNQARSIAAKMFAGENVRIDWRSGRPSGATLQREQAIAAAVSGAWRTMADFDGRQRIPPVVPRRA